MAKVHIIGTGGTIASQTQDAGGPGDYDSQNRGAVASVSIADIVGMASQIPNLEISAEDVMMTGSYLLGMSEILDIVTAVIERTGDPTIDGVVVTHGTDTLEETAFLAELVNGSETTVVFTGAQRSADRPDTDGPRNLHQALAVAADPRFRNMGSLVCFDGVVQSARGARKAHTTASQPFAGGATVGLFRGDDLDLVARPARRQPLPLPGIDFGTIQVDIETAYPGSNPDALLRAASVGASGIVLAGTGVGNAGRHYAQAVARLVADDIPVVLASRAPSGPVVALYGNGGGVDLLAAGAVSAGSLNPFQARMLAVCLLTGNPSVTEFNHLFSTLR